MKFEQFIAAAEAVAQLVTDEDRKNGWVFPELSDPRKIAKYVAAAVAFMSYEAGIATNLPKPPYLLKYAKEFMYTPQYKKYV